MSGETELHFLARAIGLNKKQMNVLAGRIGYTRDMMARRCAGDVPITKTDSLAMAAVRFGIPAWDHTVEGKLDDQTKRLMELAAESVRRCLSKVEEAA